jgi:hypothetical protein
MKINYFNKFIIEECVDTHLRYLLAFRTASGKASYKDGNINFFNRGTAEDFMNSVIRYQTDFVKENLIFMELAIPNRNAYGRIEPGYIKDTVFLQVTQ